MHKKGLFLILIVFVLTTLTCTAYAFQPISIYVDGQQIKPDVPAQNIDGRVMVPVRFIAEALEADVAYDSSSNRVIITTNKKQQYNLLKLNGERTTWPYWVEGDKLYLEKRNCIEMLRTEYRPPWHSVNVFADGTVSIDHKNIKVDTKQFDGFTAIYINDLQRLQIIDYDWDAKTGNLTLRPMG